jgi:hypothetical protein
MVRDPSKSIEQQSLTQRKNLSSRSISPKSRLGFVLSLFYPRCMSDHPASWRMPSEKQLEKMKAPSPREAPEDGWWNSVLSDPALDRSSWVPIQNRRLSEIPREMLRVECRRCGRCVEITCKDAARLVGPHAVWKELGMKLLEDDCQHRTGRHEEDGCWPSWGEK